MKYVPNAISRKIARQVLLAQKNSPSIMFGAGVVGVVGSTVLACKATLKLESVLSEAQNNLSIAKRLDHPDYSEDDRNKDIALIYVQSAVAVGKLYGPAVVVGAASIAALTHSHNVLNRRNAALTAAYTALDKGFAQYRQRVVEAYGEDKDREFRYGSEKVEITDPKTKKKKTVDRVIPGAPSIYARFFDEYSASWSKEPEYNALFLNCQQNYANDLLHARGHVFLNEVYDMLGIPRSQAGAVVGWVLSDNGDNYIDFGIFNGRGATADFVNGREGSILLDFNVDGLIWDLIDESSRGEVAWQS